MSTTMPTTWLTADAHDKLALELDSLQRAHTYRGRERVG